MKPQFFWNVTFNPGPRGDPRNPTEAYQWHIMTLLTILELGNILVLMWSVLKCLKQSNKFKKKWQRFDTIWWLKYFSHMERRSRKGLKMNNFLNAKLWRKNFFICKFSKSTKKLLFMPKKSLFRSPKVTKKKPHKNKLTKIWRKKNYH